MTHYDVQYASEKVDGYLLPRPLETQEDAFNRAKKETIQAYQAYIKIIESLTFEQFKGVKKKMMG